MKIELIHPSLKHTESGEYLKGPDQIIPSESYFTSDRHGAVRIRGTQGKGSADFDNLPSSCPISIPTMLMNTAKAYPNNTAFAVKRDGEWIQWSYEMFHSQVRSVAKAFIHLGLERLRTVAVLGINSPEWFIAENAAIFAGGVIMGIYTTNSSDACLYSLDDSKSNILIVEDDAQLQKILPIRNQLKHLKAIVQYTGQPKHEGVLSWRELLLMGESMSDDLLEYRLKRIAINQMCILVYTSGTTGNPKGVMLSHDNMVTTVVNIRDRRDFKGQFEKYISFLPLSHVAAQAVDMFLQILTGSAVYFADKDALKGSLIKTLCEIRPTIFLGVPRVYEKIYEKVQSQIRNMSFVKRFLFDWSRSVAFARMKRLEKGDTSKPYGYGFASMILLKVQQAIGFDQCSFFASGAASIPIDVLEFIISLNIPAMETFGMSECCGPHTFNCFGCFRLGSMGRSFHNGKVRIDVQQKDNECEELSLWGRNVFMGYLDKPEFVEQVTDEDGWVRTGDLGKVDENGYVFVTGRKKDLIVTSGGENIPPIIIEDNIKFELPCVSNAVLVGEGRKFVSVLLTLKCEIDPETDEPTDKLLASALDWCKLVGSPATTVSDILLRKDDKVYSGIEDGINRANVKALSNPQHVRKWVILPNELSITGGELGPTMKVKRDVVVKKYSKEVDSIYKV